MNSTQIDSVLSQIRAISAQVKPRVQAPSDAAQDGQAVAATGGGSFAALMKQGLSAVNQAQQGADELATDFQRGKPGVELADVMVEMQKASVAFRATVEVRNKMVSAYQEIMNMQV